MTFSSIISEAKLNEGLNSSPNPGTGRVIKWASVRTLRDDAPSVPNTVSGFVAFVKDNSPIGLSQDILSMSHGDFDSLMNDLWEKYCQRFK